MSALVDTAYGRLEGVEHAGLSIFKGIPFAAPPIGAKRWLPPQRPERWSGVRSAESFGSACPHIGMPPGYESPFLVKDPQSEDCLYLNVWTPGADDGRRPVMVWIHGGGYDFGAGSQANYDGRRLAQRDVVVVTINYRVGPFGFLNLAEATSGLIPATGNEGLLDQVAALEWVRDNIAGFGGNPDNVTIFGESAGGWSVGSLMAMPSARGLFHKAIAQSGIGHMALCVESAAALGRSFLQELGVSGRDVDKMRAASPAELLAAAPSLMKAVADPDPTKRDRYLRHVIDGTVMPRYILDAVAAGDAADVPFVIGTTRDELSQLPIPEDAAFAALPEMITQFVPREVNIEALAKAYEKARLARPARATPREIGVAIAGDAAVRIPSIRALDAHRRVQPASYHYIFGWTSPAAGSSQGAPHGVDIGFTFGTHADEPVFAKFFGQGPAADALANAVMDAWSAFARTGDPSTASLGQWPAYGEARRTMIIGERTYVEDAPYEEERQAWEAYPDDIVFRTAWFKQRPRT
jgi:para-nitrobenzyl esterase